MLQAIAGDHRRQEAVRCISWSAALLYLFVLEYIWSRFFCLEKNALSRAAISSEVQIRDA